MTTYEAPEETIELEGEALTEYLEQCKLEREIEKLEAEIQHAQADAELKQREAERDRESRERFVSDDAVRVYVLDDSVDELSVESCRLVLWRWHRRDGDNPRPMTILINSPGGSVFDGFALFDEIRTLSGMGHHITTVVRGMAASMAGVLFQAGDTRLIGTHSRLHLHEPASMAFGKASDVKDSHELLEDMFAQMCDIYAVRSTLSAAEIRERVERREWWLRAQEAVELGFADAIG